jgi:hypothetical protein
MECISHKRRAHCHLDMLAYTGPVFMHSSVCPPARHLSFPPETPQHLGYATRDSLLALQAQSCDDLRCF